MRMQEITLRLSPRLSSTMSEETGDARVGSTGVSLCLWRFTGSRGAVPANPRA